MLALSIIAALMSGSTKADFAVLLIIFRKEWIWPRLECVSLASLLAKPDTLILSQRIRIFLEQSYVFLLVSLHNIV